jgi:hypothetical protein
MLHCLMAKNVFFFQAPPVDDMLSRKSFYKVTFL